MSGKITAISGKIGGFEITQNAITGSRFYISGAAQNNDFFISSSKFNVKANGDVTGSNVLFNGGKIAGFLLTKDALESSTQNAEKFYISSSTTSTGFFISSSKFNVKGNGDVTGSSVLFTGGTFSGTVIVGNTTLTPANTLNSNNTQTSIGLGNVQNLNAQNQATTGLAAGTTISAGGITLSGGGSINGGQTSFNTGTGFFLGYESSAYKFSIGDSSTNYLTWNGSTLAVRGTINVGATTLTELNTLNSNNTQTSIGLGNVQNLNAQNQATTGLAAGTTISAGGITLSGGGSINGGQTSFNTGTGFFLGYESSAYKFSIGNASTNYLTWNGSTLAVGGTVTATAGNIGGFTISNNSLSNSTNFYISGSATGNEFFISSSKFNVKANGDVTASNAKLGGHIEALSFVQAHIKLLDSNTGSYQTAGSTVASKNLVFDGSRGGNAISAMTIATTAPFEISGITTAGGTNQLTDVTLFINTAGITLATSLEAQYISEVAKSTI